SPRLRGDASATRSPDPSDPARQHGRPFGHDHDQTAETITDVASSPLGGLTQFKGLSAHGVGQRTTAKPPVLGSSPATISRICRKPIASSSRARSIGPASMASKPPALTAEMSADFASASSPATKTVVATGPTCFWLRVAARVVLNALIPREDGSAAASSAALELSGDTTSESKVSKFSGLVMSTTILPASSSPYLSRMSGGAGGGTAS